MADGDDEKAEKQPRLQLISGTPTARSDREIAWAKDRLEYALSQFAAALLRTIAGSNSEAMFLIHKLSDVIDALSTFEKESGHGLPILDLEQMLRLPEPEYVSAAEDWRRRRWLRDDGMHTTTKGALRLAAHKLLGQEPHFGGKYSEKVIEQGIEILEELKRPLPPPQPIREKPGQRGISLGPPENTSQRGISARRLKRDNSFSADDLKELRKAIKEKDDRRIAELATKIGQRSPKT